MFHNVLESRVVSYDRFSHQTTTHAFPQSTVVTIILGISLQPYNGQCYWFSSARLPWQEAKEMCEDYMMHLAVIHSASQHDAITNLGMTKSKHDKT